MLIPPSIALVLYGIIADVSIGQLLVGGVIPGILVTLTIIAILALMTVPSIQARLAREQIIEAGFKPLGRGKFGARLRANGMAIEKERSGSAVFVSRA